MSYFLNIYQTDHSSISESLNLGLDSPDYSSISQTLDDHSSQSLKQLFSREYSRDPDTWESPDAFGLITSLEHLCQYLSSSKETIEFYLDDERAPELCSFSFNDWDVKDDFGLPLSSDGTPAVIYRDNQSLPGFLKEFESMAEAKSFDEDCISMPELRDLISIISRSITQKTGLFIFCTQ